MCVCFLLENFSKKKKIKEKKNTSMEKKISFLNQKTFSFSFFYLQIILEYFFLSLVFPSFTNKLNFMHEWYEKWVSWSEINFRGLQRICFLQETVVFIWILNIYYEKFQIDMKINQLIEKNVWKCPIYQRKEPAHLLLFIQSFLM